MSDLLKRIICTLLLALFSFGFSVNVSAAERWQWIASTDFITVSYDTQSVRYSSTPFKTVEVWVSWEYTEEGAKQEIADGRKRGKYQAEKWNDFSFCMDHMLISKNSQKGLDYIYYDVNGNVLKSVTHDPNSKWKSLVPNTIGEQIRNKFSGFLDS